MARTYFDHADSLTAARDLAAQDGPAAVTVLSAGGKETPTMAGTVTTTLLFDQHFSE